MMWRLKNLKLENDISGAKFFNAALLCIKITVFTCAILWIASLLPIAGNCDDLGAPECASGVMICDLFGLRDVTGLGKWIEHNWLKPALYVNLYLVPAFALIEFVLLLKYCCIARKEQPTMNKGKWLLLGIPFIQVFILFSISASFMIAMVGYLEG